MKTASFAPLPDRGILALSGPDTIKMLQGLISQDVEKARDDLSSYGALLTPQGKFLHDFLMVRDGEAILLDCESARRDDLFTRLRRYRLRSAVELIDRTDDLEVFAIFGENAPASFALPPARGSTRDWENGRIYVDPRRADLGCRAILPAGLGSKALAASGLTEVPADRYDEHRARLCVPDGSRDIQVEKSTLLEANLDRLNGIDWEKGCYVGQELTARTKHRGLLKRRLRTVRLSGPAGPGTPITNDQTQIGELRSVAGDYGLALLRLDALDSTGDQPLLAGSVQVDVPPDPLADEVIA